MRTRSSSNLPGESSPNPNSSNPKRRNRRRLKQPFILEESPVDTMADQRTMAELLRAPTEGYTEAIVVPPILAEQFELKHSLINMMTSDQFFRLKKDNPHDHIPRRWLEKEPPRSILTWEDLVSKFINKFFHPSRTTNLRNEIYNFQQRFDESFHEAWDRYKDLLRAFPHYGFTELHQLDTFYNALNPTDQDSLNSATGGNLLERRTQDVLTIIEKKSKIAKRSHAVNQQISVVTTAMTAILKQFQATPPPASVKAVEEICVTCGGTHPYYQCLAADGNTFLELQDNIQGYVSAAVVNYNQASMSNQTNELKNMMDSFFQMNTASTSSLGPLPRNTIFNSKGELKAITTRSGIVLDGPSVPMPPPFINPEEGEHVEETLTDSELDEFTIKVPPPLVQKLKPPSQRNYVMHQRDPLHPNIPYPSRMHKQKQKEKFEVQIHKFWQMFKQLHINITLADALILIPKYQKMLKALISNKEKLLKLANTPLNENCSVVILKKLPEKLRDPLIPCGFTNQTICTPTGIARDVFVPVGKFTFPVDFVIFDYESVPRVLLILGRPFLRTARGLIDVHREEMILRDGDERLTLNMRHDTSSYSNQPQKESINMISIFNDSCEDFLEDLETLFLVLPKISLPHNVNPLSGSTTSSSPNHLLEEFADELALITFPSRNDDLSFDIESDLKEIEYLLNHDHIKEMDSILEDSVDEDNLVDLNDNLVDTIPEMFTDEHALDYSSPSLYDDYDDDLDEFQYDNDDVYSDPFDSKGEKIKESKLLINELDLPRSSDFLPSPEYDSFLFEDVFEVDALPSTNNKDKDFDPPLYELPFYKEVPGSKTLLSFSSKNEEKVCKPGILTYKGIHTSLLLELSHRGPKAFKVIKILESPMEIFLALWRGHLNFLDCEDSCSWFCPSIT
nr:hypothetical protein [Tanacetum cinerariifolium]